MNRKKAKALLFLGWHFFVHLFSRVVGLFSKPADRSRLFVKQYHKDHVFPLSPEERVVMSSFSGCYSCRLCDLACPEWNVAQPLTSPSYLVTGYSRGLSDFANLQNVPFDCKGCSACEAICPQNVPIKRMITFVRDHLRQHAA